MKHLLLFAVLLLFACTKETAKPLCDVNGTATLTVHNTSQGMLALRVANDDICDVMPNKSVTVEVDAYLTGDFPTYFDHENVDMLPCNAYTVEIDGV
jgi:hypothetical protein